MSLPTIEDEQNEYFHAEIEARYTNEEVMEEFAKLMKERIYKQDADAVDWAVGCLLDNADISDMKDELVYAYKTKEWDYDL